MFTFLRHTYKIITFFVLLISVSQYLSATEVKYITSADGLSNSSVNAICQDSHGYMWFGTWDGLSRYNGRDFEIFRPSVVADGGLSSNIIRHIVEDAEGNVWVATDKGIDRYNPDTHSFHRYFGPEVHGLIVNEHSFIVTACPDGTVAAAFSGEGFYTFDSSADQFKIVHKSDKDIAGIYSALSSDVWVLLRDGTLYRVLFPASDHIIDANPFGNPSLSKGISCLSVTSDRQCLFTAGKDGMLRKFSASDGALLSQVAIPAHVGTVNDIYSSAEQTLIATTGGLYSLNDGVFTPLLTGSNTLCAAMGTQDIIWAGTDMHGVARISDSVSPFMTVTSSDIPALSANAVRSFLQVTPNKVWVGTKGAGICLVELSSRRCLRNFTTADGLADNNVYALCDSRDCIWIGTDGESLNRYDKRNSSISTLSLRTPDGRTPAIRSVYSILQTSPDVLWVGTSGNGLYRLVLDFHSGEPSIESFRHYTVGAGLSNNIVFSIVQGAMNDVMVATRGGGLAQISISGEPIKIYNENADAGSSDANCLLSCPNGDILVGTSLGIYKISTEGTVTAVASEAMLGTSVHGVLTDEAGNVWASTNSGLLRIETKEPYRAVHYTTYDGLQDNEFSDGAYMISQFNGELFFGGINGFCHFNPSAVSRSHIFPSLNLEDIHIDNVRDFDCIRNVGGRKTLVLDPGRHSITLHFVPQDYISPYSCELSYQLEGYTNGWISIGNSSDIVLSNLKKGSYRLMVRCSNSDKVWSDDIFELPIMVLAPWYATAWAKLAYILLALIILAATLYVIISMYRARLKIRQQQDQEARISEIHEAKLRFFTNIAHEFSNSLSLVYGPCKELRELSGMPSSSGKYLDYIESNASRMLSLIQQLISFRKAETGHLVLRLEEIDIAGLIHSTARYFRGRVEENSITMGININPETVRWVADRDSLEKIIFNLLSNAIKYTPSGGVVTIDVTASEELSVSITNTGVGIPREKWDAIFDRFEVLDRFEKSITKGKISNGIGLSMCKNLVELMNGRISIDSDEHTWTRFSFTLPVMEADTQAQNRPEEAEEQTAVPHNMPLFDIPKPDTAHESVPGSGDDPNRKYILIVDDDDQFLDFVYDILKKDYNVLKASNGRQALDLLGTASPDLIISDIMMPELGGVGLLRAVREQERFAHLPLIFLTADNSEDNQLLGLEKGADAFLGKPFSPKKLLSTVSNLLTRNEAIKKFNSSVYSASSFFRGHNMSTEDRALMKKVTEVISKNIASEHLCVEFIADEVAISKMQLYRKVKENLGITPIEYVKTIRLEKAAYLLKTTSMTIQQVMFDCGFNSKTYFYKEFVKKFELKPKDYRNANQTPEK